jgi:predicted lipoprotein with Yx(FWY)xxD motif
VRILGRDGVTARSLVIWSVAATAVALLMLSSLGVFSSTPIPKGTVVSSITTSKYGSVLVVGGSATGGLYKFPLYEFSGDVDGHLGCGTAKSVGYDLGAKESVPLTCTGPQRDLLADVSSDDWPALTSKVAPIAGRGVNATLLGTVFRRGIGHQVTYAGHPLYLFDPSSSPFEPQGENFMETVTPLPPWHGFWYLVSARSGAPSSGVATIQSETLPSGQRVLAVIEDPNVDPIKVTVYSGASTSGSAQCDASCARAWTPVLTSGEPHLGPGVNAALVSITSKGAGEYEVSYDRRRLYLYDHERVQLSASDKIVSSGSTGNGAGKHGPYGVMSVVALPR